MIDYAKKIARTVEEYLQILKKYDVEVEQRGKNLRYKPVEASKWIRDKSLGEAYQMPSIVREIAQNQGAGISKETKELQKKLDSVKGRIDLSGKKNPTRKEKSDERSNRQ